jgi:acyl-CoA thioester hydrolase
MPKIEFELPIYTYQIDFLGHVSNIVYLEWTEIARLKLMEAVGMPVHQIFKHGFAPILVQSEITYKQPFHLGDRVFVEMWLTGLTKVSVQMASCFYKENGSLSASASQKGIFIDLTSRKPIRLKPLQLEQFAPYLDSQSTFVKTHSEKE